MRLIIAGSRKLTPTFTELDKLLKASGFRPSMIVNGMHWEGVDAVAWKWAKARKLDRVGFPANWEFRGKGAGPYRNKLMAQFGSELLLIWDGLSSGSESMLEAALDRGLPCEVFLKAGRSGSGVISCLGQSVPAHDGWHHYSFEGRVV